MLFRQQMGNKLFDKNLKFIIYFLHGFLYRNNKLFIVKWCLKIKFHFLFFKCYKCTEVIFILCKTYNVIIEKNLWNHFSEIPWICITQLESKLKYLPAVTRFLNYTTANTTTIGGDGEKFRDIKYEINTLSGIAWDREDNDENVRNYLPM